MKTTRLCQLALAIVLAIGGCGKDSKGRGSSGKSPGDPRGGSQTKPLDTKGPNVITDSVKRSYDDALVAKLDQLSSADAAEVPAVEAGALEVALTTWKDGKELAFRVSLDTSQQVFSLSIPEDISTSSQGALGGSRDGARYSPPLAPSLAAVGGSQQFVSASMLGFKAKQFDDGLYAAVELAADAGAGSLPSRRKLLADLATTLEKQPEATARTQALGLLGAATRLGGHPVEVPAAAAAIAAELEKAFLADPLRSKPLGFYTWSDVLVGVFRRDRLLQAELDADAAEALAEGLDRGDLLEPYQALVALPRRLTNSYVRPDLVAAAESIAHGAAPSFHTPPSLFPPSRAYETDLVKRLYGDRPIPQGFNLADEMVRRIQSGKLDLTPRPDSGWYDYQTYALEPLVAMDRMPESAHLELDKSYRDQLTLLFKALLALTRETHVKQLEIPTVGAGRPPDGIFLEMPPQLSQEPLASFYLRRAQAYRFVRGVLTEALGADGLAGIRRLTAAGPVNLPLDRELALMEGLLYGAYVETAHQLGMAGEDHADLGLGPQGSLALYRAWQPDQDPDVARDVRMMVPLYYDQQLGKIKVWVVLGVTSRPLDVSYSVAPVLKKVVDAAGQPVALDTVHLSFPQSSMTVAYPVMAEVYVSKLLDRNQLRALCDQYKTREEILAHLE